MQVEAVQEKKEFKPIKLILTIESAGELYALWHRFNVSSTDIKECSEENRRIPFGKDMAYEVWKEIDTLIKRHQGIS